MKSAVSRPFGAKISHTNAKRPHGLTSAEAEVTANSEIDQPMIFAKALGAGG